MSRTLILLSFLLTVCLISKSDAPEKHGDVMARPRLLLATTTRKNISSEYSSTSHDKTITGVLSIIGSTVDAGGDVLLAANDDITLKSADETSHYRDSNKNSSAGIGVSVGVGLGKGGGINIGLDANVSKGKGSGSGNTADHVESVIRGDNVEFASVDDTTIKGGQIIGDSVVGTVGGDLSIVSEQDSESHKRDQSSWGAGGSVGWTLGAGGASVGGNYSSQDQKGKSDYDSVDDQSGIFAGEGGFDIAVGGNTHLEGAVIDSTADAEDNLLTTGSLTTDDIYNNSEYESSTGGWGGEFSYVNKPGQGDKNANKGSISPSLPMNENGDESSSTKSAVAEGTIVITDEESQLAKTGQTAEETIDDLNRDTDNAHEGALDRNPDLQDIFDKQAELVDASAAAGKAVAQTVGDICEEMYKKTGDEEWLEGGIYKTILQGAGSAIIGELGNGSGLENALGAVASQIASNKIKDIVEASTENISNPALKEVAENIMTNVASSIVGMVAGGESGSNAASTMDRNNRQLHNAEIKWIEDNCKQFAKENDLSIAEAKKILAQVAAKMVDSLWNQVINPSDSELIKLYGKAAKFITETVKNNKEEFEYNGKLHTLFSTDDWEYNNSSAYLDQYTDQKYLDFYKENILSGKTHNARDVLLGMYGDKIASIPSAIGDGAAYIWNNASEIAGAIGEGISSYWNALINDPSGTLNASLGAGLNIIVDITGEIEDNLALVVNNASGDGGKLNDLYGGDSIALLDTVTILVNTGIAGADLLPIPLGKLKNLGKLENLDDFVDAIADAAKASNKVETVVDASKIGEKAGDAAKMPEGIWSSTSARNAIQNAYKHYNDHGKDFPQYENALQYAKGAKDFVANPPVDTLTKIRDNGDVLYYHPQSNTFAVKAADGAPRTMFKPKQGIEYFERQ